MAVADELTSGWLFRRGPTAMHNWKEQWCVLRFGKLILHRDDKCLEKLSSLEIGPQSCVFRFGNHRAPGDAVKHRRERPFGFVLDADPSMGKDRKLVYLDARDLETLDRWLNAFQQAYHRATFLPLDPTVFAQSHAKFPRRQSCSFNAGNGQKLSAKSFQLMPSVATWYVARVNRRRRLVVGRKLEGLQTPSAVGDQMGSMLSPQTHQFQRFPSVASWLTMRRLPGL